MEISIGNSIVCYNNDDITDILSVGSTYTVEDLLDDLLIKVEGIDLPVFIWRFVDPSSL